VVAEDSGNHLLDLADSGANLSIVLPPPGTIAGRVTSGGASLGGVTVTLSGAGAATTTTDAQGRYSFIGLANGTYTVTPSRSSHTFTPTSRPVTLSGTAAVGVDFVASPAYTLSVTLAGSSAGSVSSSPAGISGCTGTCSASFTSGTVVTLTASPGAGGTFREWRGDCTGSGTTCQVTMNGATSVTAVFSKTFTDPTLTAGVTAIKAVHFTDLRAAIDTLRSRNGLAGFSWTDGTLTPGSTPVKRQHLLDLRTALNQAYTAAGRAVPTYSESSIVAGTTPIKASHLTELRTLVRNLE
jgi:hypothetical protein